jgi:hypothetical protein
VKKSPQGKSYHCGRNDNEKEKRKKKKEKV